MLGIVGMAEATIVSQGLDSSSYTASSSWNADPTPDFAFDGDFDTGWNAGTYSTSWIEVDLGMSTDLTQILLSVTQAPDGPTTHEVWSSSSNSIGWDTSDATLSYTFSGDTSTGQLLSATFLTPLTAQYIQIRTVSSPSWVAWNEIQVMSADPVPEPASMLLFGTGLTGLVGTRLRRKKK